MSYNITRWKLKELKDFAIPYKAFFSKEFPNWHPDILNLANDRIALSNCGDEDLIGHIENDWFEIKEIEVYGEGSGNFIHYILEPAFKKSRGLLVVACVWEGGDTINILTVKDGTVSWEDINL